MIEIKWLEHKGKEIFLEKYESEDESAVLEGVLKSTDIIIHSGKDNILMITDLTNMVESPRLFDMFKMVGKVQQKFIRKNAVVGLSVLKRMALKAIAPFLSYEVRPFNSREEALDWLVRD